MKHRILGPSAEKARATLPSHSPPEKNQQNPTFMTPANTTINTRSDNNYDYNNDYNVKIAHLQLT
jgi:hypothetical protein